MSFGWGAGDGIVLLQQARSILQATRQAFGENDEITHELSNFCKVLERLFTQLASPSSGPRAHHEVQQYLQSCLPVLNSLENMISKMNMLSPSTRMLFRNMQMKDAEEIGQTLAILRSAIERSLDLSLLGVLELADQKVDPMLLDHTTSQHEHGPERDARLTQDTTLNQSTPMCLFPESTTPTNQLPLIQLPHSALDASVISYSPLNEYQDEIRLINILPYTGDTALVHCTLSTVSLKAHTPEYEKFLSTSSSSPGSKRERLGNWAPIPSAPKSMIMDKHIPTKSQYRYVWGDYAALSYVWGGPSHTRRIVVNDQEIQVGHNLEVALRALSKRPDFQVGFKLWVDAICINQEDYTERGRQISKMRDIYGDAWTVIAWLGEEGENSSKAMQLVQSLADTNPEDGEQLAARLMADPNCLGTGCWTALDDFMYREYWYRLWIIQELVLGSSALVLRCGDYFLEWTTFCWGVGFLFDHLWTVKDSLLLYEIHGRGHAGSRATVWSTTSLHLVRQDLWALSQYEEQGRGHLGFSRLLNVANSANSRDDRDKVYGLVGMMDPIIAKQLVPNYRAHPAEVFASVAKIFILTERSLDPLREGNPWSQTYTPSWAADWTWNGRLRHRNPEKYLWGPFWTHKGRPHAAEPAIPFRASGGSIPEVSFSNNDLHLTCRGFIVDKIDGLAAREQGYFEWSKESIVQPEHGSNMYGDVYDVTKALYLALIADRVADGQRASERHAAVLNLPSTFASAQPQFQRLGWQWLSTQQGYYFRWEKWRLANVHFRLMGLPLDNYFNENIPDGASEYDYTEVYSCVDRTGKGRRFMTTVKGYLGWVPDNLYGDDEAQTKNGDLIAIVFGCSTPLVIRPEGKYFLVVGEAYVQGLMEGEAVEFWMSGECVTQDFTFC